MALTDILKKGLKYPQHDFKNAVLFSLLLLLGTILSNIGNHFSLSKANINSIAGAQNLNEVINGLSTVLTPTQVAILIIFSIASFIVSLFASGYIYRVYEGEDELPHFEDYKLMLIQGIKVFIVNLAYCIIPIILLVLGLYIAAFNSDIANLLIAVSVILGAILIFFISPFAIANMVKENSFKQAFNFNAIGSRIYRIGIIPYLVTVILMGVIEMIIVIAFGVVMLILSLFVVMNPIIGIIVLFIMLFVGSIVCGYVNLFTNKVYQLLYS
ncbi:MAG: DUF4013 domain-containing protein [Methanobrevibacter sp.]|uniref:DUF4013 domain-containing protein n=1 Tax=Methanobrevibacter sp. TaxID=66852 RepID=UPI0026DFFA20|nr:DUF4013 domain-containing protein [Methanobrevibacter sp.]MDO5847997.1 DUF4013 domain-containing protein [Methanobrevibacter sp.]